ncbi:UDP-N-acetylglucosamine1-carboxyvinyltransferase, partial [Striga asiatica]
RESQSVQLPKVSSSPKPGSGFPTGLVKLGSTVSTEAESWLASLPAGKLRRPHSPSPDHPVIVNLCSGSVSSGLVRPPPRIRSPGRRNETAERCRMLNPAAGPPLEGPAAEHGVDRRLAAVPLAAAHQAGGAVHGVDYPTAGLVSGAGADEVEEAGAAVEFGEEDGGVGL